MDVPIPEDVQLKIRGFRDPTLAEAFFNEYLHSAEYQTLVDQAQAFSVVSKRSTFAWHHSSFDNHLSELSGALSFDSTIFAKERTCTMIRAAFRSLWFPTRW